MYASVRSSKSEAESNLTRQGSLRKVINPDNKRDKTLSRYNEEYNKIYKQYQQEYLILSEYHMLQTENIQGVYVIPSRANSLIWFGVVFPRCGAYREGVFRFNIHLDEAFPDAAHPKVIFQSEMFHPVIDSETRELFLLGAFPTWNKNEQHLWQVLKYIQWIFSKVESTVRYAVNEEAANLFKNNQEGFNDKVKEIVAWSQEHLYDPPPIEDKHYITFEEYNPEIHEKTRDSMLAYKDNGEAKLGHSWVLPGSYKSLSRPASPQSESEL